LRKLRLARDAAAKKGFPTINAGKPWSELDLEALWSHLRQGTSLRQIAQLLAREVQAKLNEVADAKHLETEGRRRGQGGRPPHRR
jgi:hypothetical protein